MNWQSEGREPESGISIEVCNVRALDDFTLTLCAWIVINGRGTHTLRMKPAGMFASTSLVQPFCV
jgi:hypothetical protein